MISRRRLLGGLSASVVPLSAARALSPVSNDGFLTLEARRQAIRLLPPPAAETECFSYNGAVPGPVLRVKQGAEIKVRLVNRLDQPTTLHWQGLRGENAMDGVAGLTQPAVAPGGSFDYRFKAQDSGLYVYKPSVATHGASQIARGLSGVLVVDEEAPPAVDRDFVVAIQDWKLEASGAFAPFEPTPPEGRSGDLLTANAQPAPLIEMAPPGARVRLRLVNLSVARIAIVTFRGASPRAIAIDGQPCDPFQLVRDTAPLAPGARFDFLLDMPGKEGETASIALWAGADTPPRPLLAIKALGARVPDRGPIPSLAMNRALPPEIRLGQAKKVELAIEPPASGKPWTINGAAQGYRGKPLFSVKRGTPVSIGFQNRSNVALAMHVHGFSMRLLHDKDDGWEPYWRNAVIVPKGASKHVALLADAPGKWAVHCDISAHEAAGLAAWFEVT